MPSSNETCLANDGGELRTIAIINSANGNEKCTSSCSASIDEIQLAPFSSYASPIDAQHSTLIPTTTPVSSKVESEPRNQETLKRRLGDSSIRPSEQNIANSDQIENHTNQISNRNIELAINSHIADHIGNRHISILDPNIGNQNLTNQNLTNQHIGNQKIQNHKEMSNQPRVRYLREQDSAPTLGQRLYMRKFGILIFVFEILFVVLFAIYVRYGKEADASRADSSANVIEPLHLHPDDQHVRANQTAVELEDYYPMFQDVHVMMFIGFGFLMTFLKRYGYSAVGMNFLLAAFVIQWAVLTQGFLDLHQGYIQITITQLISSDFAAAAVLISMGALLGKLSPEQYIIMGFLEVLFYTLNEYILFDFWNVTDAGDSMTVHTFGAYFGLTIARVLYRKGAVHHTKEGSSYNSDIFAMIGTIFLWVFWPSFNGGLAQGDQRHRAVLNTYISLAACCIVTYAVSALLNKENKFDMVHVQNATLAGGVAVGTSANLMIQPFVALIIGSVAGIVSVVGFKYITPFLARKLKIHDTCGVHNLHGMPGILAAIVGGVFCYLASTNSYGNNLYEVLPAMKDGRSSLAQAGYQFAGLGVTLAIAVGGGLITGLVLKLPFWIQLDEQSYFDDEDFWEVPPVEAVQLEQGQLYLAKKQEHGELELEKVHQVHSYS